MAAIKFETFALDNNGEDTLEKLRKEEQSRLQDEAYANGFKDGVNVTNDALQVGQTDLAQAIEESLSDVSLSQSAAVELAMAHLSKVIEAFCKAVSPNIAAAGLGAELGSILEETTRKSIVETLQIEHSHTDAELIEALLQTSDVSTQKTVKDDLGQGQVRIKWDNGFDLIDMDEAVAKALLSITNFANMMDEENPDG